ncbi:MAG: class I SAM-dependent methyltransferase [Phycisphaerae bacterium]
MSVSQDGTTAGLSEMKRYARRRFEAWAGHYDQSLLNHFLFRPSYIILMEEIARWYARHRRPFRVLDVGSGTGTLAAFLAHSSWPVEIVGLDYAPQMCLTAFSKTRATHRSGRARFINGDSEHLPFADASCDVVTCSNSFHHYPHQQTVVAEMSRLLAPGGLLIIIDGFRDCVIGWFVFDVLIAHIEKEVHHVPWPLMHQYFVSAGLSNIRRRQFNFLLPAFATIGDKPFAASRFQR